MHSDHDLLSQILTARPGSIVAPAGCGKTELIADAVIRSNDHRLILTHTHAGVDAIRTRLKDKGAKSGQQEVTTIAAWSLRMASAFPQRSQLQIAMPRTNSDWDKVYVAAARLLKSGCINSIITYSYDGVLVDEYQDCIRAQHDVIGALAKLVPCCIFGDPLQEIFNFRNQAMPDWDKDVIGTFPLIEKLDHPHRWYRLKNEALGNWLMQCRDELDQTGQIDLRNAPPLLVRHWPLTTNDPIKRATQRKRCVLEALKQPAGQQSIVIGDSRNENGRALLARDVNAVTIEPFASKQLADFITKVAVTSGKERLVCVLRLVKSMMTKAEAARLQQRALSTTPTTNAVHAACRAVTQTNDLAPVLSLLEGIRTQAGWVYRPELFSAVCATLSEVIGGAYPTLAEASWHVQNRRRHVPRRFGQRTIGSTLLVKGLEFDHVIITDVEKLGRNDLYVALTRGSRTVHVVSASPILRPVQAAAISKTAS